MCLLAGLSFGKAIAGIYAQAKGRRVGIYEEREKDEAKKQEKEEKEEAMGVERVDVFGMKVHPLCNSIEDIVGCTLPYMLCIMQHVDS